MYTVSDLEIQEFVTFIFRIDLPNSPEEYEPRVSHIFLDGSQTNEKKSQ